MIDDDSSFKNVRVDITNGWFNGAVNNLTIEGDMQFFVLGVDQLGRRINLKGIDVLLRGFVENLERINIF